MSQMSTASVFFPSPAPGLDYPEPLELKYLQVIFRHGERTPVKDRLESAGIPRDWKMCNNARRFFAQIQGQKRWTVLGYERKMERPDHMTLNAPVQEPTESAVCYHGELTDIGRTTTRQLGEYLRERYIQRLKFLPDALSQNSQVYMRATPLVRALESLEHVFEGLYPEEKRSGFLPVIYNRNWAEENLLPNENNCPRLRQLYEEFATKAAIKFDPLLAGRASEMMSEFMDGQPVRVVSSHPRLSGLLDTINAAIGNHVPLHPNLTDTHFLSDAQKAVTEEWFGGYKQSKLMRVLGAGSLLNDLYNRMESCTQGNKGNQKLELYGAHDVTVAAILAATDSFDYKWPPFTSHLELELFQDKSKESAQSTSNSVATTSSPSELADWYVRINYNSSPVVMGACKGKGFRGDDSICPLTVFKTVVRNLNPTNYDELCRPVKAQA
ncbi:acid phosphatase [Schizosaccharomyces japonicus yFS275]|uniref:Acid phosphatase n=1 Tax=Schizosaccharomyces japonicus (strain yFS275 / FY16936) TaxID=402676 RepID=B6JWD6_SCHJY|nr:acid phosphatase [Schizosaccharomyces japonicus yFS275]EEB05687.1 acid phosphatase [Schizosaccharomyces japonicus yFS275]